MVHVITTASVLTDTNYGVRDMLEVWREHANGPVEGRALYAGHYLAEEQPPEVLEELLRFFGEYKDQ